MVVPTSPSRLVSPAFQAQVVVIGAGVVGLAIARALAKNGKEVLVLEKATHICSETSSRNSEVIHAGIYYPKQSLKAQFCVQGKQELYQFCRERSIDYNNCGKLIVATNADQLHHELPLLYQKTLANGVDDVCMLTSNSEVKELEPNVDCLGALWSPSTGVLDSHSFALHLEADAEDHGATIALNTTVDDAAIINSNQTKHIYLQADDTWIQCETIINSSGLWAHKVASLFHQDTDDWKPPKHYFAKGTYFRLQGKSPFSRLIYPVPEPGGLGVHATIDWSGQTVKFGPDVEWVDPAVDNPNDICLDPDPQRGDKFYEQVRKYWSGLLDNKLVPDYVGIRPKLQHPSIETLTFQDFQILDHTTHGIPGLIHLFGIESPGLTSSMAIANHVSRIVQ